MNAIDGLKLSEMVSMGAHQLHTNADYVDSLNVFPVPDGDTGTNMNLSMTSGAEETEKRAEAHVGKTAQALSKGLLMGARGNSGVILSQLFRGFAQAIKDEEVLTAETLANGLQYGVETAYRAVMKPVEGTILTVAKDAAAKGVEVAQTTDNVVDVMEAILKEAQASLERTPDLLPVLKQVGVVDSGGQGLVYVYEGFVASLKGEELPEREETVSIEDLVQAEHHRAVSDVMNPEDIVYGYCTEFMVLFEEDKEPFVETEFRRDLSELGDSLLIISDDEVARVHVHTEQPGVALNIAQKYGSLTKLAIDNMREQNKELSEKKSEELVVEQHPYAIVTVALGSGIAELLRSIGASYVIEGGQTMNPSTEDIVKAIEQIGAERVLILPNNKNIVMAAKQAAEVLDIEAAVVETRTIPQGIAAILAFNPEASVEENAEYMSDVIQDVKTGQITSAVRDTSIDGVTITKDDFMGIQDGKIVTSNASLDETFDQLCDALIDEYDEIVTLLYGEDITEEEAQRAADKIEEKFEDVEVEIHEGRQPLYPYIISVE